MKKAIITFLILLVLGIAGGIYYFTGYQRSQMAFPKNMTLETTSGETFTFDKMSKKVRVVEFMYTSCPDICPNTTGNLQLVRDELVKEGLFGSEVEFLTITMDPKKDTLDKLAIYEETFRIKESPGWIVLRTSEANTKKVTGNFKFLYRDPGTGFLIHTTSFYLLDRNNKVVKLFDMGKDFDREGLLKAIRKEVEKS